MTKVGAFSCLAEGLKALRPNLFTSILFTMFLSAIGAVPTLISRLQGHAYSSPPISLWGFLMTFIHWTTLTLILVGVSQVVWGHIKKTPYERVHLLPSEKLRRQIFFWSILFTVLIFVAHLGSWFLEQSAPKGVRFVPLPILPLVFYFLAFIPLMMVDQQVSMCNALKQAPSLLKVNFVSLFKLALTAQAVFLLISIILGIALERLIFDLLSMPRAVVIDQVIGIIAGTPAWVINSAMMAVAYAELHGTSAVEHQVSPSQVIAGR